MMHYVELDNNPLSNVAVNPKFVKDFIQSPLLQHFFHKQGLMVNMSNMALENKLDIDRVFRELIRTHGDRIYNLALLKSNQITLAQDICQETYLRVYKGLPRFRNDAQLGTWIYKIALNVCHTILKKESRITKHTIAYDTENGFQSIDHESDVQELFLKDSTKSAVRRAISALPAAQSDAITLYYLHEFQYTEVAEIMNIPINTVKSHLRRAKEKLRELIPEDV